MSLSIQLRSQLRYSPTNLITKLRALQSKINLSPFVSYSVGARILQDLTLFLLILEIDKIQILFDTFFRK
jgi:hypothetical protein